MQNSSAHLFHPRIIKKYLLASNFLENGRIPLKAQKVIERWLSNQTLHKKRGELETREDFLQFFKELLGYKSLNDKKNSKHWDISSEKQHIDFALGKFSQDTAVILVPFEFKGADSSDLSLPMKGRKQSAVDQALGYALKTNGTAKWFLVGNCVEIRLYKFPHSSQTHEHWLIEDLIQPAEYARFVLLLSKENLLGGKTETIFNDSQQLEKDITAQLYSDYRALRVNLINGLKRENGHIRRQAMVARAQKLMDRMMFIAFAENRELLPRKTLSNRISEAENSSWQTVWDAIKTLCNDINKGNLKAGIYAYNGGLFAPDSTIDNLKISDELLKQFDVLYSYDFSEIGTHILGHIFEQSIADLDEIYATVEEDKLLINVNKTIGTTGKRKQDGIVYTPAFITEYIIEHTLGTYLADKQAKIKHPPESVAYWLDYRKLLATTRVLDPACGSGAFLIGAFNYLKQKYALVNQRLKELEQQHEDIFSLDLNKEILNNNLFGVDLNFESVEITQLALWLETAEPGKKLNPLDENIQQGNSIIAHKNADKNAFNWKVQFNKIMEEGGFDVVLGNPPYVRQERLTDIKPYLEKHYQTYHGVADLYSYFFELGLRLLKKNGRLGFISSSTFFRTNSGQNLRTLLSVQSNIKTIIYFGDYQVFEGVTTYPAILLLEKPAQEKPRKNPPDNEFRFLTVESPRSAEHKALIAELERNQFGLMPQKSLKEEGWQLENQILANLRKKIINGHRTLKEVYGSPYYGIKTGLNEAFVINQNQYQQLRKDDLEGKILKPFLEGKDLKRWHSESRKLYLILFPKGWTHKQLGYEENDDALEKLEELEAWTYLQTNYPRIAAHLLPFADKARKRSDKGYFWWELRSCAYYSDFEKGKIIYNRFMDKSLFCYFDKVYFNNALNLIPNTGYFEAGLFNSNLTWFILIRLGASMSGGFYQIHGHLLERIPIPEATDEQKKVIAELAEKCQEQAKKRYELEQQVREILLENFQPQNSLLTLNKKLSQWWLLSGIKELQQEARKAFKLKKAEVLNVDLDDPGLQMKWLNFLNEQQQAWQTFTAEIERCEKEINISVYELFGLSDTEIKTLEDNL